MNMPRFASLAPLRPVVVRLTAVLLGFVPAVHAATPAEDDDHPVSLEKFEIVGTRPHTMDATTLKLSTTVLDTPRSLTVFDASRLQEQDIQTGGDLLFWVPGLNTNGTVQESYHFYARGYRMAPNDWRVDGFAGRVVGGSYNPNLFGVEQVSILKGPAGLLYGSSGLPGGMINLVSKQPRATAATTVEIRVRTFGGGEVSAGERWSNEVEFDSTGPVTRDGRLLFRALASVERNACAARSPADDNQFYRISFTYHLDAARRFRLSPVFEWSREDRAQRHPSLSPGSSRTPADGRTDYTLADVTPRTVNLTAGGRLDTQHTGGADLAAEFSPRWKARAGFRVAKREYLNDAYALNTATLRQTDAADPQSWVVSRRHSRAANSYKTTSFDLSTTYEFFPAAPLKSMLQFGLNGRRNDNTASSSGNGPDQSPVNIYDGFAAGPLVANSPALAAGNSTGNFAWNAYAQSQTEIFKRWIFTAGFGYSRERNRTVSPAGVVTEPPARSGDVSPNFALVHKLTRRVSLYTSYSNSYSLADPTFEDAQGRRGNFGPTQGDNYEAGAKASFWGNLLAASFTLFDTELNGVLVQSEINELNSNGARFYRQLDNGRKSRGVETEFTVSPVPAWDTTFTYAYLDAFDRGATAALPDTPAEMTPRHAISAYSRYAFLRGPFHGLSARVGVIWQSERWSASRTSVAPDPLLLSSFHRIDAGLGYQTRSWRIALSVENATNNYYLLAGSTGVAFSPVNPRSYALRVSRMW
ncbi:MAG TPA: TonB-dependent receptor [Opitutaceae bacterium]|nr:TonB-dependent receptor [Opitutaceae bacterium]